MKRFSILSILAAALLTFASCDKIAEDEFVVFAGASGTWYDSEATVPAVQRAFVEKYTGVRCVNCPNADVVLHAASDQYGDQLIIAAVHVPNNFGKPLHGEQDLRSEKGSTWFNTFFSASQPLPCALLNRAMADGTSLDIIDPQARFDDKIDAVLASAPRIGMTLSCEKDGNNYTVHMFDPKGNPVDVVVDNKLLCNSSGGCAQVSGKNGKFDWATIMEKALMKWETCFRCNNIGGIGTEHAAPPFTGNGDSFSFDWGDKLYNAEYAMIVDYALSNGMISVGGFHTSDVPMGDLVSVTGHAFTVMYADEGADYLFVMRNPWGNEPAGSTATNRTDGKLKIPCEHEKLRLVDFRLVYPGAQMAEYKKENLAGYTPPRFNASYDDMNPSQAMLRMYNVKNYVPVFPKEEEVPGPYLEETE